MATFPELDSTVAARIAHEHRGRVAVGPVCLVIDRLEVEALPEDWIGVAFVYRVDGAPGVYLFSGHVDTLSEVEPIDEIGTRDQGDPPPDARLGARLFAVAAAREVRV